jgi:hypothetical protein
MENLEKTYNDKIKEIEKSVNRMKDSVKSPSTISKAIQFEEISPAPRKIMIQPKPPEISEIFESDPEDFKSSNLGIVIESSESEIAEKIIEVAAIVEPTPFRPRKRFSKKKRSVKAEKKLEFLAPPERVGHENSQKNSPEYLHINPTQKATRNDAIKLFKNRLKIFGIQDENKLSKTELSKVNDEMVQKREELKKVSSIFKLLKYIPIEIFNTFRNTNHFL